MENVTMRNEVIFCCFDDILVSSRAEVLKRIIREGVPEFEESIDTSNVSSLNDKNILRLAITSKYRNTVCEVLDKDVLEYETEAYVDEDELDESFYEETGDVAEDEDDILISDGIDFFVRSKYPDLYDKAPRATMGMNLNNVLINKATDRVYIYTPEYDKRIEILISNMYAKHISKVVYVHGDFQEVVEHIIDNIQPPTAYFLNDIFDLKTLVDMEKPELAFTNVALANMGYNYTYNELNKSLELTIDISDQTLYDKRMKLRMFDTVDLTEDYFTGDDIVDLALLNIVNNVEEEITPDDVDEIKSEMIEYNKEVDEFGGSLDNVLTESDGTVVNLNKVNDDTL